MSKQLNLNQTVTAMTTTVSTSAQQIGSDDRQSQPQNKPLPEPLRRACGIDQPRRK